MQIIDAIKKYLKPPQSFDDASRYRMMLNDRDTSDYPPMSTDLYPKFRHAFLELRFAVLSPNTTFGYYLIPVRDGDNVKIACMNYMYSDYDQSLSYETNPVMLNYKQSEWLEWEYVDFTRDDDSESLETNGENIYSSHSSFNFRDATYINYFLSTLRSPVSIKSVENGSVHMIVEPDSKINYPLSFWDFDT